MTSHYNKLVVLGTNYYSIDLVKKAKLSGYETHMFGLAIGAAGRIQEPSATIRKNREIADSAAIPFADFYYPISILDKEKILDICFKLKPVGVIAVASDVAVPIVNYLACNLGLTCNGEHSALVSTNKLEMKKQFKRNKIPTADFTIVDNDSAGHDFDYPVIIKSIDRAGKFGITKVDEEKNLRQAIRYALDSSFCKQVLIEEYIDGQEWSIESMSHEGKHRILTMTEKYSYPPHFVEEVYLQPAPIDKELLTPQVNKVLNSLYIRNGPSHMEFKLLDGQIKVIEVGARIAADFLCNIIEITTEVDWIQAAIDVACGMSPDLRPKDTGFCGCIKFVVRDQDFDRFEYVKQNHADKLLDYNIAEFDGREVLANSDRYGHYILRCGSREEALDLVGTKPILG